MAIQTDIISLTILRQREALYQIHKQFDISRTELEVLAFAADKIFFTVYELQKYYQHTNVQQIRRSLKSLVSKKLIMVFSKSVENIRINYAIVNPGKQVISQYAAIILSGSG